MARARTQITRKRHGDSARPARGKRRARRDRRPHRPQQSPVHGSAPQGPRRPALARGPALIAVAGRRRQFQVDQRPLWSRSGRSILRELAARFRSTTRAVDTACRLGGEEFVILMPARTWPMPVRSASACASPIAAEPFPINRDSKVAVTASVGIASLEGPPTFGAARGPCRWVLYAAKRTGRNRVERCRIAGELSPDSS